MKTQLDMKPQQLELPLLPSVFYAGDIELSFICRCLDNHHLISKAFRMKTLEEISTSIGISKKDQIGLLQNLLRLGVIYSLSPSASQEYIDPNTDYFLHAEKATQALINQFPEYVVGRQLFKFENEGQMLDGGFVNNEAEVFDALMERLTSFYGLKNGKEPYLPGFIRLYKCIGLADGRDFFTKERKPIQSLTTTETHPPEKAFYIPKYVVLTKNQQHDSWSIDNQRLCVCIN